ncbi:MAG: hypothetical protein J0M18_13840 [Ignavibacteria bacterium]|nr:hypothetical protein [Ignavibacteria bacterium]
MDKIITREKVEERIPFCFGVVQRIADDLNVSRSAVANFLDLTENSDLKEIVKSEKKRIKDYAEMTVIKRLLGGDIETAKWYMTNFSSGKPINAPKPYKPKKAKDNNYLIVSIEGQANRHREFCFGALDYADGKRAGANTKYLPYEAKEELGLINSEPAKQLNDADGKTVNPVTSETEEEIEKQIERNRKIRERNKGKSGHEVYEEFKRNWKKK